ncbi:integrase catalytic domain-containing protein [Trichonephila clavipes]|uniref:Integrase catalytic domain-containing protein n=1 Tax=Trichonephila clavipes TaxID=2585209 RepID=A0A8X6SFP6_TRICX|nr:integrase catalytic domain-containing protein [Trichonephila clavipes]
MKEVVAENDNSKIVYYMPHHGILRPEKSTTKLRVVFNATNPTKHPYAFMADVMMMYRMMLIHESQPPLLRILWKESPEDPVKTFEIKTVTYGTVSTSFLATRILLQLSRDEDKNFPLAAPVLKVSDYVRNSDFKKRING